MADVLTLFEEGTARWFRESLGEPTPVQQEAWPFISAGEHVLGILPVKTGFRVDRIYLTVGEELPPGDAEWDEVLR